MRGDVIVTRFADDFVLGFQYRSVAEKFLAELRTRFARFGLKLHPGKIRLIEFGRYAVQNRERRKAGKPETFNFLGFTHICGKTKKGMFTVLRKTMRKKWQAKLREVYAELRRRRHAPIPEQGAYLRAVIAGHIRYYGVPMNSRSLNAFYRAVQLLWLKVLRSRSQKSNLTWDRMGRLVAKWFPSVRIFHPYPLERYSGIT